MIQMTGCHLASHHARSRRKSRHSRHSQRLYVTWWWNVYLGVNLKPWVVVAWELQCFEVWGVGLEGVRIGVSEVVALVAWVVKVASK